jgi:4-amino-4-deoxy-L-arabinose transferase-like glycosyltransferase
MLDSETVETASSALDNSAKSNLAAGIGWAILILATLYICYFSHLGAIGFVGPDEPRYAWIARDMAETGDWVTPRLYGKPWFEKPPLFYWGAALCFKLFGVSEAAARLPSAIAALLATLALAWLAFRLYGAETTRWLLLLLPTTVGMIGFSHAASTDMPFSAMLTIAMVCAAAVLGLTRNENSPVIPQTPWLALVLFGFFLGLAVLAKGPAGIILVGGAVFFWALFTKRWRDAFRLFHPAALASFFATALPWYILCARRNPDFFRIFIIEHNFKRFLTPEFQHIQPFWYYIPVLLVAFLPWTGAVIWAMTAGALRFRRAGQINSATTYFVTWTGFCLVFFSVSQSKLPGYILPAIPAIGLVLARCCGPLAAQSKKSLGITVLATSLLLAGVAEALGQMSGNPLKNLGAFQPAFAVLLLLLAFPGLLLGTQILCAGRRAVQVVLLVLMSLSMPLLIASMDRYLPLSMINVLTPRGLARQIQIAEIPVGELKLEKLTRSMRYGLNFYLRANLIDWDRDPSQEVYVLTEGPLVPCKEQPQAMTCTDLWIEQERIDRYRLLHLVPKRSADSLPRSGQLQQEK